MTRVLLLGMMGVCLSACVRHAASPTAGFPPNHPLYHQLLAQSQQKVASDDSPRHRLSAYS